MRCCDTTAYYFKIFCEGHAHTFHSYLHSLGQTPAAQHSTVIWLTKINCRSCVPGDASCPESHCDCYMTAALLYSLQFLRQQSPAGAISPYTPQGNTLSFCASQSRLECISLCTPATYSTAAFCATCASLSGTLEAAHQYFHLAV